MSFKKSDYCTLVQQASDGVVGFRQAYSKFVEHAAIHQKSRSLLTNYSRNIAQLALHFGTVPHFVSTEEINSYLYRISVHEGKSEGYFKQTVHALRYWFRVFGNEAKALRMPPLKAKQSLPTVLYKEECKALFKAPRTHKHRFRQTRLRSAGLSKGPAGPDRSTHRILCAYRPGGDTNNTGTMKGVQASLSE